MISHQEQAAEAIEKRARWMTAQTGERAIDPAFIDGFAEAAVHVRDLTPTASEETELREALTALVCEVASRRGTGADEWAAAYISGELKIAGKVNELLAAHPVD